MSPAEILALSRMLERLDYYRLLRVDRKASLQEIRSAYHRARTEFNPDRFLSESPELQQAVDRIAKRLTEAWMVIRDGERRPAYDRELAKGRLRHTAEAEDSRQEEKAARQGRTANGRKLFATAEAAERAGDLAGAISRLKMAVAYESDNETFQKKLERLEKLHASQRSRSSPHQIGRN